MESLFEKNLVYLILMIFACNKNHKVLVNFQKISLFVDRPIRPIPTRLFIIHLASYLSETSL